MPKKFFRKFLPTQIKIAQLPLFSYLGKGLHQPALWHVSRRPIAKAMAIGLAVAMIPIPGQMLLAALLAIYWRATLPLSVALVWLTNPVTTAPILYLNYLLGSFVLRTPIANWQQDFNSAWLWQTLHHIWLPLCLGTLILAALCSALGYWLTTWLWRRYVQQARQNKRTKHHLLHKGSGKAQSKP